MLLLTAMTGSAVEKELEPVSRVGELLFVLAGEAFLASSLSSSLSSKMTSRLAGATKLSAKRSITQSAKHSNGSSAGASDPSLSKVKPTEMNITIKLVPVLNKLRQRSPTLQAREVAGVELRLECANALAANGTTVQWIELLHSDHIVA
jgi:hypothetical protein